MKVLKRASYLFALSTMIFTTACQKENITPMAKPLAGEKSGGAMFTKTWVFEGIALKNRNTDTGADVGYTIEIVFDVDYTSSLKGGDPAQTGVPVDSVQVTFEGNGNTIVYKDLTGNLVISNNVGTGNTQDRISLDLSGFDLPGDHWLQLSLIDQSGTLFQNADVPTEAVDLSEFDIVEWAVTDYDAAPLTRIWGDVTGFAIESGTGS